MPKADCGKWQTCCCGFYCLASDAAYWLEHVGSHMALPPPSTYATDPKTPVPKCQWNAGDGKGTCGEQKDLNKQVRGTDRAAIPVCNKHILDAWRTYPDPVVEPL